MKNVVHIERILIGSLSLGAPVIIFISGFRIIGAALGAVSLVIIAFEINRQRTQSSVQKSQKTELAKLLTDLTNSFTRAPGLNKDVLKGKTLGIPAPSDYWDFLMLSNGAEGNLSPSIHITLWPLDRVLSENGDWKSLAVVENSRTYGLFFFANDDKGIKYAFRVENWNIIIVAVVESGDIRKCGNSCVEFLQNLRNSKQSDR